MVTTALATIVDGVDTTTAMVFGLASVAWAVEETFRRVLIARREFGSLVVNDGAFAIGAFGLLALVIGSGAEVTMLTMMAALLAGALVGIAVMARHGASERKRAIPFGPFLALGGVVGLLAGDGILDWYLDKVVA
jgi:prepilin signal peptidase PulO-like enzyme (type II secretory pathway)